MLASYRVFNNEGPKLYVYISGQAGTCNLKLVAKFAYISYIFIFLEPIWNLHILIFLFAYLQNGLIINSFEKYTENLPKFHLKTLFSSGLYHFDLEDLKSDLSNGCVLNI